MSHQEFQLAGGSIIGRDHRVVPRNNQDAHCVVREEAVTVAVVADGCGSSPHSEVGAQLGARLLADCIMAEATSPFARPFDWASVQDDFLVDFGALALRMGDDIRQAIEEYFLFTLVGVLLTDDSATFFAYGDGIVIVNGETSRLGPYPGNAPPYIAYNLLDAQENRGIPGPGSIEVVRQLPITELETFLIGTDGVVDLIDAAGKRLPGDQQEVGGIEQFWQQDRYFHNSELVHRRLKLVGRDWPRRDPEPGLLPDDTTLIVGRRMPADLET